MRRKGESADLISREDSCDHDNGDCFVCSQGFPAGFQSHYDRAVLAALSPQTRAAAVLAWTSPVFWLLCGVFPDCVRMVQVVPESVQRASAHRRMYVMCSVFLRPMAGHYRWPDAPHCGAIRCQPRCLEMIASNALSVGNEDMRRKLGPTPGCRIWCNWPAAMSVDGARRPHRRRRRRRHH